MAWARKDVFELVESERRRRRARFSPWIPLGIGIGCAVLSAALNYFAGGRFRGGRSRTVLCEWCQAVGEEKPGSTCECGGEREPLDDWKWVEEEGDELSEE